jgi:hypothetical protein
LIGSAIPNQGDGILISGHAHDNVIAHTYVGTNDNDTVPLGNVLGGVFVGPGTSNNTSHRKPGDRQPRLRP